MNKELSVNNIKKIQESRYVHENNIYYLKNTQNNDNSNDCITLGVEVAVFYAVMNRNGKTEGHLFGLGRKDEAYIGYNEIKNKILSEGHRNQAHELKFVSGKLHPYDLNKLTTDPSYVLTFHEHNYDFFDNDERILH